MTDQMHPYSESDQSQQDNPENKAYRDKSVQERMNRPTPQQQRTGGREGGEDIEGQTPVDREQGQGAGSSYDNRGRE